MAYCIFNAVSSGARIPFVAIASAPASGQPAMMYLTFVVVGGGAAPSVQLTYGSGANRASVLLNGPDAAGAAGTSFTFGADTAIVAYVSLSGVAGSHDPAGALYQLVFSDATPSPSLDGSLFNIQFNGASDQTFAFVVADQASQALYNNSMPLLVVEGPLDITGTATIAGTVNAGTATVQTINVTGSSTLSNASITGPLTISGGLTVAAGTSLGALNAGTTTVGALNAGTTTVGALNAGTTTVGGLTASGAATLLDGLAVTGNVNVTPASATVTLAGPLAVKGQSTLAALNTASLNVGGSSTLSNTTIAGNLNVTGSAGAASLGVPGPVTLGGTLSVGGAVTMNSARTYLLGSDGVGNHWICAGAPNDTAAALGFNVPNQQVVVNHTLVTNGAASIGGPLTAGSLTVNGDAVVRGAVVSAPMVQAGTFTWDLHTGPFWTGSGNRSVTQAITFPRAFPAGWKVEVYASLMQVDFSNAHNARLTVSAQNSSLTGFNLVLATWSDTQVWDAGAMWVAIAFHP